MNEILRISEFVLQAVWHAWPFFLVSIVLSVLVRSLKLEGLIRRFFDHRTPIAIVLAVLIGAFSPFCACTVVPIIAGLLASGVPLAPVMAFWIASPTMDPEIFALSVGVLGWPMAIARLGATLVVSLGAGFLTMALSRSRWLREVLPVMQTSSPGIIPVQVPIAASEIALFNPPSPVLAATPCTSGACAVPIYQARPSWSSNMVTTINKINWLAFGRDVVLESWKLGRWLLLAFILEAVIVLYIPQDLILSLLGEDNWLAIPLAALVGVPLYMTNISALPVISGLLAQGMLPGAAIAFLIAGPVTTLPAMTAVWGIVHRRIFILYLATGLCGAILLGIISNWILA